jgi:hypothetical protein
MLQPDPNERFRLRRQQARRRRAARRLTALALVVLAAAALGLGFSFLGGERSGGTDAADSARPRPPAAPEPKPEPRPAPAEMRGVHVTMALLTVPGKLDEYLSFTREGMNTLQLDVKDENGEVAFASPHAPLARRIGSAQGYYRPRAVIRKARAQGLYVIARVVVFEDPFLARARPGMAIRRAGGGVWENDAGLGWGNPYDKRVWKYNVDVAESAARVGFDEIMFDYVRFPSDGDIEAIVYPGRVKESKAETIARFLDYARGRLEPLGVRVSAAVFGLSATRPLGIGQQPTLMAPHLDAIYPMVYPSHYGSGEYGIEQNANPGATVTISLRHFRRALRGTDTKLIPWLQDFTLGRTYTLADVQAQIQAARRMRTGGFLLWNAGGVYTVEALAP